MNADGFNSSTFFPDGLITDLIEDESKISAIELDPTTINFDSFDLKHNGVLIPTGASAVSNPLLSTLDCNFKTLSNCNFLNVNAIRPLTTNDMEITVAPTYISMQSNIIGGNVSCLAGASSGTLALTGYNVNLTGTVLNYNSRISQLVDIHSGNNTYSGLTSAVGTQFCTSYGNLAGSSTSLTHQTAIGYSTMPVATVSANRNTAVGSLSLGALTDGNRNVAVGAPALRNVSTGSRNMGIGSDAGLGFTTGSDNVCLGYGSNTSQANNGTCANTIIVGNSNHTNGNASNTIIIGNNISTTLSNEIVIGTSAASIMRSNGAGVCDLGSTANKYKDIHLAGKIETSSDSLTVASGRYMSISSGPTITGVGVVNLLNAVSSVGSLTFAAGFPAVCGYKMNFIITLNAVLNDILYLKFLLGGIQILALDTTLTASSTKAGNIELEFYITTLSATVGVVNMAAKFQYDDGGTVKGEMSNILYSTLNTTISQALTITAAFNTASASNSILCTRALLNKIY